MAKEMSRRSFLKKGAAAAIGLAVVPSTVLGKKFGHTAPSDKLNILGVGIGGRGASVLKGLESQNIIGLCDVDWKYAEHVFQRYPAAKRYNDYRRMYDEMLKSADAVMVATADHTHAIIAADAITAGKHVYCEKPLTHTVYESRLLTKLAAKHKVATQMGNQGASAEGVRKVCEWIWNGEIGEVRKVEAFTDRPIWPQVLMRPENDERVPKTLNWDAFIGPAPMRPYNSIYTPWNFRGWWDFGTGALGDMACHILHPVFKGLKLGYPTKVQGSSTLLLSESCPTAQTVKFVFPARDNMPKVAMPEVEVYWYDGGLMPTRPEGLPAGKDLNVKGGGAIFYGTKDTLICGCYGADPYTLRAAISPSIGKCCFETDSDVANAFFALLDPAMDERIEKRGDKYHIDLKAINRLWLLRAGIDPSRIDVHPDCTKCHPERYWSHRAMGDRRGGMAAMICLTEDAL